MGSVCTPQSPVPSVDGWTAGPIKNDDNAKVGDIIFYKGRRFRISDRRAHKIPGVRIAVLDENTAKTQLVFIEKDSEKHEC